MADTGHESPASSVSHQTQELGHYVQVIYDQPRIEFNRTSELVQRYEKDRYHLTALASAGHLTHEWVDRELTRQEQIIRKAMEPQHQIQPSPPIQRFNSASLFNKPMVVNCGAALGLALIIWFVAKPAKQPVPVQPAQPQVQQPIQPQQAPVFPVQQPTPVPVQPQTQVQPIAPTYETLQVQQPMQPVAIDANEAEYQRLVQLYLFDNAQFNQIVAQYQGWMQQRYPGDATAAGLLRMVDESVFAPPYPMPTKQ